MEEAEKVLVDGSFSVEMMGPKIQEAYERGQIKDVSDDYPDEFMVVGQGGLAYLEEAGQRFKCMTWGRGKKCKIRIAAINKE